MIDLFPSIRATLKADSYFAGFTDSKSNFKVFRDDEAPTDETPFITVEQAPVDEDRNTLWSNPQAIIHITGKDTDWHTLFLHARTIRDIFRNAPSFAAVGSDPIIQFELIGPSIISNGRDPVTDNVTISLGLTFGILD
jgi:hypothetical protein